MRAHESTISGRATLATVVALLWAAQTGAFPLYSDNIGATGGCADCHGAFKAKPYDGPNGSQPGVWPNGLHDTHRNTMLNGDCDTCHFGAGTQGRAVRINSSAGGLGFDTTACIGCHGRAEDRGLFPTDCPAPISPDTQNFGPCGDGAGLREHHAANGITFCGSCHSADLVPVGEDVPPPYYFTPDTDHPDKPTDPCNTGGVGEDIAGGTAGLDNDGDNLYDEADPQCVPEPGTLLLQCAALASLAVVARRRTRKT